MKCMDYNVFLCLINLFAGSAAVGRNGTVVAMATRAASYPYGPVEVSIHLSLVSI